MQLVVLIVFLSVSHLGRLEQIEDNIHWMKSILVELIPFMKDIKSALNYQEANLTSFNESVRQITQQLNDINDYIEQLPVYTCGGTGGWRRVVYLDMTDPASTCPSGWQLTGYSKRTCGRASSGTNICDSVTFPVDGSYTKLCGRIKAYQWASPDAFLNYHEGRLTTINDGYIDGVSLTHGNPRQHIWTFAAGVHENNPIDAHVCPCDASINITVPPFVGEDYFCESGVNEGSNSQVFYPDDPLWDGENCLPRSNCCSLHGPPYFTKQLTAPTTDNIEARICLDEASTNENIAVELVELYVQ